MRLVKDAAIPIEESYNLIDSILGCDNNNKDDDDDIVILQGSVKVSMRCPITFVRLTRPVRGKNCKHVGVSRMKKKRYYCKLIPFF
jgi:SUMO ligase MMS21 Smc5/6 complex component